MKTQHFQLKPGRLAASCAAALLALAIFFLPAIAQEKLPSSKNAKSDSQPLGEPAVVARGRVVFGDRCGICHFSDSDAKKIGPGLKGIYKRGKFANGGKVDDASMQKWIMRGGKDMPPLQAVLNPVQIRDLLTYLKTL